MRDDPEDPDSADNATRGARGRRRNWVTKYRRAGGVAVFAASAAVALAAFSGTSSSHVGSHEKRSGQSRGMYDSNPSSAPAKNNSMGLLEEWAACERGHGDSNQADPTVDHAVIYIAIQMRALRGGGSIPLAGTCGEYLAAAQRAVAGGQPIQGWGDQAKYVKYANCMRANGYPTFPYPSGIEPDGHSSTNFNGTGIDPNSPAFLNGRANQMCGKQIGAPAWWINNWGPPGAVDVYPVGGSPSRPFPAPPRPMTPKPITEPGLNGGLGGNRPAVAAG